MRLAVMQPYFLPYLGYFQLMAAVDKFVIYDDVHFIKRGWINRNRILVNGRDHLFTIPLQGASQNRRINEIVLQSDVPWRQKLVRTIEQAYRRAPYFPQAYPLIREIILFAENKLTGYVRHGLTRIKSYLEISTEIVPSSEVFGNAELKGQDRILDICGQLSATDYVNAPGGRELYDPEAFRSNGIALRFLEPEPYVYKQFGSQFHPALSIVDVLMFNSRADVKAQLGRVQLQGYGRRK